MNINLSAHGRVLKDAVGRSHGQPHGDSVQRARGRGLGSSPPRQPGSCAHPTSDREG